MSPSDLPRQPATGRWPVNPHLLANFGATDMLIGLTARCLAGEPSGGESPPKA